MTTRSLVSIGSLAMSLHAGLADVRRAAKESSIHPAILLDSVDYFDASDVEAIEQRVRIYQRLAKQK